MTTGQLNSLLSQGIFYDDDSAHRGLIETHISWVIVCDNFVYKIKKPVHYSFLNFSTLEKRRYFCKKEVELNKRLSGDLYITVQAIRETKQGLTIGGRKGAIIDYAVKMHKMDRGLQMDKLLQKNKVTKSDIRKLAKKIALFHQAARIIKRKNLTELQTDFNDLGKQQGYLQGELTPKYIDIIEHALAVSDGFLQKTRALLKTRLKSGFFRDCHGDLHSRNIFLLPAPLPFDCIEFNDDFRQIDVLNEVAFLCMDLDAFGRQDLSEQFMDYYHQYFPVMNTGEDQSLFTYYKSYRANIRAKVNSLRAKSSKNKKEKSKALAETKKYLRLMDSYIKLADAHY